MQISRRHFLAASSALLMNVACSQSLVKTSNNLNAKKGIGGAAPLPSGLRTSWYYNWGSNPSTSGMPSADPSMQFLPMVWGWYPNSTPALLASLRTQHPLILLGFNEPDHTDQSNIPVEVAIAAWSQFQGIATELVAPAAADPLGTWLQTFMSAVEKQNLQVDSIAVHNYGGPSPSAFLDMLGAVHDLYQRPIWVTEFAVADWQAVNGASNRYSATQVAGFMQTVCPAMDQLAWIKGYAWFPWASNSSNALASSVLFDSNGNLTELGTLYASL
jgi:hypothetical protein